MPPWIFIGAVAILFPIFAFMTLTNINRLKENSIRLLVEKGAALIRSFEAGTRTGMKETHWKNFKLQKLLTETAQQPDIVYIIVTDGKGTILAHNDIGRIGAAHAGGVNFQEASRAADVKWRLVPYENGPTVFEVYRRFSPTLRPWRRHREPMMHHRLPSGPPDMPINIEPRVIFVGLDMTAIEEARQADIKQSLIMAAIMLFL